MMTSLVECALSQWRFAERSCEVEALGYRTAPTYQWYFSVKNFKWKSWWWIVRMKIHEKQKNPLKSNPSLLPWFMPTRVHWRGGKIMPTCHDTASQCLPPAHFASLRIFSAIKFFQRFNQRFRIGKLFNVSTPPSWWWIWLGGNLDSNSLLWPFLQWIRSINASHRVTSPSCALNFTSERVLSSNVIVSKPNWRWHGLYCQKSLVIFVPFKESQPCLGSLEIDV